MHVLFVSIHSHILHHLREHDPSDPIHSGDSYLPICKLMHTGTFLLNEIRLTYFILNYEKKAADRIVKINTKAMQPSAAILLRSSKNKRCFSLQCVVV